MCNCLSGRVNNLIDEAATRKMQFPLMIRMSTNNYNNLISKGLNTVKMPEGRQSKVSTIHGDVIISEDFTVMDDGLELISSPKDDQTKCPESDGRDSCTRFLINLIVSGKLKGILLNDRGLEDENNLLILKEFLKRRESFDLIYNESRDGWEIQKHRG